MIKYLIEQSKSRLTEFGITASTVDRLRTYNALCEPEGVIAILRDETEKCVKQTRMQLFGTQPNSAEEADAIHRLRQLNVVTELLNELTEFASMLEEHVK